MKSFYKNQNLNLIASTAQQIVFNNSKNGKLESTNTQDAIDEISNILDEEKTMISDAWNSATTYTVGQYCIYNNALWKCLVANTNIEPAEGTHWTQTTIDAEISALNSNLSSKVNSDHFIIEGGLKLPSSSEGLICKKDYLVGYLPIASITKMYGQYRTNVFIVALANDGTVYGTNIPSNAYGAECIILFVKNKSF